MPVPVPVPGVLLLLRVLLLVLLGPPILLPARDAVRHGGGRPGDGRGACDTSEKWHVVVLSPVDQPSAASSAATRSSWGM